MTLSFKLKTLIAVTVLVFFGSFAYAGVVSFQEQTKTDAYEYYSFFSATTTSATSTSLTGGGGHLVIAGAKSVNFYFSRGGTAGANTGSSKFEVEVSPDGTDWYDYNRLFLSDTAQTATSTIWITAATSTVVTALDVEDNAFYAVRCQVTEVTDGEHTCAASVEF